MAMELIELDPFTVYMHQYIGGPNQNQVVPVNPGHPNLFGVISVVDWPLTEGPELGSPLVGRAKGQVTGIGQHKEQWHYVLHIRLEDARFEGSTLEVKGSWEDVTTVTSSFEWTISGGTGALKLAQGVINGKNIQESPGRVHQLDFRVFYRQLEELKRA